MIMPAVLGLCKIRLRSVPRPPRSIPADTVRARPPAGKEGGEFGHLLPVRSLRFSGHGHSSGQRDLPRLRSAAGHARARRQGCRRQRVAWPVGVTKWDGLP